jgi:hypothetical protein
LAESEFFLQNYLSLPKVFVSSLAILFLLKTVGLILLIYLLALSEECFSAIAGGDCLTSILYLVFFTGQI